MKFDIDKLEIDLADSTADEKMTAELALIAAEMAENWEGTPEDFSKAVKEKARADNPDFKFSSDGGHSVAMRVLKELVAEKPPPEADEASAKDGLPPPKPKAADQTVKTKVALNDKIVEYGGQFYDPTTKVWINGTKKKPQEVILTLFVQLKIGTGELIEIR